MTSVSHVTAMYATKRRRRNSKNNVRTVCSKDTHSKSNPSKRHRERLNQELDTLASLLPFEQSVLSKLDKLSILRLSVSYLRTKSYFQAALSSGRLLAGQLQRPHQQQHYHHHQFSNQTSQQQLVDPQASQTQQQLYPNELLMEGDLIVQALNGFLLILTCDGEVFYTSHTVETYLGFHQSDICHQSVYELVHSEDREELMQQLKWNSLVPQVNGLGGAIATPATPTMNPLQPNGEQTAGVGVGGVEQHGSAAGSKSASQMSLQEILASADHRHLLERNFTVRFRCLLDNTSGFLRLDIRGRIKVLHGQQNPQNLANSAAGTKKQQQQQSQSFDGQPFGSGTGQREPMLAFFGVCIPFGPPSLLEMPSKDSVFKSKHRLDLSIISMEPRGKQLLGLNDLTSVLKATLEHSPTSTPLQQQTAVIKQEASAGKGCSGSSNHHQSAASSALLNGTKQAQQQNVSAYDLVHHDDLSYMASAHQELLKTGASGLIAYRMITQEGKHQWLQTSAKLYYKNSKPDYILCTHRPLMEEEGRDLLGKRTMDFKVTYLDVGLSSITDRIMACDKFSSLQALGSGSCASSQRSRSPTALTSSYGVSSSAGGGGGSNHHLLASSSPALSGESSRSLASLSPQSSLLEENQMQRKQVKRKAIPTNNYDLSLNSSSNHQQYNSSIYSEAHPGELSGTNQQQQSISGYSAHLQQQQQQVGPLYSSADNTTHPQHYLSGVKGLQNSNNHEGGDIFYDMDATNGSQDQQQQHRTVGRPANKLKKTGKSGLASQSKQASKKTRELHLTNLDGLGLSNKKASKQDNLLLLNSSSANEHPQQQQQQVQQQHHHLQQHQVSEQLHLYSQHYNQHHLHHHHQAASEVAAAAAAADSYSPAIQAAAVYAASLGHPHLASHHQTGYGAAYHAHHNPYAPAASMVAPSSVGYSHHHHQHPHHHHQQHHSAVSLHHHLEGASYQPSATGAHHHHHAAAAYAAGAFSAAAANSGVGAVTGSPIAGYGSGSPANSFLPATEHLLHHYSQSARLAAWPSNPIASSAGSSATSDYGAQVATAAASNHHLQQQQQQSNTGYSESSYSAMAAAAALQAANVAEKRDSSYSPSGSGATLQRESSTGSSYLQLSQDQQYTSDNLAPSSLQEQHSVHLQQRSGADSSPTSKSLSSLVGASGPIQNQRYNNQQQRCQNKQSNGPASLNSDGSAHRSPLSSSESSNGSGSLVAAQAVAAVSAMAAATSSASASMISPNAYYQTSTEHNHNNHHHHHHQQHHQQQQQQHNYHYQQNQNRVWAHQYASESAVSHFNQHHYRQHASHHQGHHPQQESPYFQQTSTDLIASNGNSVSSSSAMAAVKLYGANELHIVKEDGEPGASYLGSTAMDVEERDRQQESKENELNNQDIRDPLAQLISSTIGDIVLDIAPKN